MKFIDPLASLQYMGGALPLHIALAIYCTDQYFSNQEYVTECRKNISLSIDVQDVKWMAISHFVYIIYIISTFIVENLTAIAFEEYNPRFLRQSLK